MTIRNLFPLLFVAVAAVALAPERASAQCWYCGDLRVHAGSSRPGNVHTGTSPPRSASRTVSTAKRRATAKAVNFGFCFGPRNAARHGSGSGGARGRRWQPSEQAGRFRPSGLFFYARRGEDFVVRRKCDAVEMGRVAVAEVETQSAAVVG